MTHLRGRVDGKLELALLSIVHRQSFHQEGSESWASAATEGVEDEETLKTCALISQLPDPVQYQVNDLLSDRVVATGVVVGCIFLAGDQLLGVEELPVCTSADLIWK